MKYHKPYIWSYKPTAYCLGFIANGFNTTDDLMTYCLHTAYGLMNLNNAFIIDVAKEKDYRHI